VGNRVPNSGETGIQNPHVAAHVTAQAAVLGGFPTRVRRGEDGVLRD